MSRVETAEMLGLVSVPSAMGMTEPDATTQTVRARNGVRDLESEEATGDAERGPRMSTPTEADARQVRTSAEEAMEISSGPNSPVYNFGSSWTGMDGDENDARVPVLDANGDALTDRHGVVIYELPGWDLLLDENGCPQYNENGDLCYEKRVTPADDLLLVRMEDAQNIPILTPDQIKFMMQKNERLQSELTRELTSHRSDAELAQALAQRNDAQNRVDQCAMSMQLAKMQNALQATQEKHDLERNRVHALQAKHTEEMCVAQEKRAEEQQEHAAEARIAQEKFDEQMRTE